MQLRFFTIPVHGGDEAAEALNRFLGGHRILAIDRSFVPDGGNSAWSLCASFESRDGLTLCGALVAWVEPWRRLAGWSLLFPGVAP